MLQLRLLKFLKWRSGWRWTSWSFYSDSQNGQQYCFTLWNTAFCPCTGQDSTWILDANFHRSKGQTLESICGSLGSLEGLDLGIRIHSKIFYQGSSLSSLNQLLIFGGSNWAFRPCHRHDRVPLPQRRLRSDLSIIRCRCTWRLGIHLNIWDLCFLPESNAWQGWMSDFGKSKPEREL